MMELILAFIVVVAFVGAAVFVGTIMGCIAVRVYEAVECWVEYWVDGWFR